MINTWRSLKTKTTKWNCYSGWFCWFNISAVLPHSQLNFWYVFKYLVNQSKTYLKLEILFVFDVHFYAKARNSWSSICHVWLQNTDLRALLFIDKQQLIGFLHKKAEQYLQTKVLMPWWGITCCLQFRRNTIKPYFYYLSVAIAIDCMAKCK